MSTQDKWIAAISGNNSLRVWAMSGTGTYAQAQADWQDRTDAAGPDPLAARLGDLVADWLTAAPVQVLICGADTGVYHPVPVNPAGLIPTALPRNDAQLDLFALPGLKQTSPPDVMQGDETRIAGFLALHEGWDGVICLPGLQTRWAHISAGEIVSFQTFLTGELFAAMSHTPFSASADGAGWDQGAFTEALDTSLSRPEKLAAALFSVRARGLLEDQSQQQAQARLWGLLIGAELAAARPYWLGQQLAVIGTPETTALYGAALEQQGAPILIADADQMALAGLTAAWQRLG